MRTFKPKLKKMTPAEHKLWRAKWIERLNMAGIPMRELLGIEDHALWQMKNRHFGRGVLSAPQPRGKKPISY